MEFIFKNKKFLYFVFYKLKILCLFWDMGDVGFDIRFVLLYDFLILYFCLISLLKDFVLNGEWLMCEYMLSLWCGFLLLYNILFFFGKDIFVLLEERMLVIKKEDFVWLGIGNVSVLFFGVLLLFLIVFLLVWIVVVMDIFLFFNLLLYVSFFFDENFVFFLFFLILIFLFDFFIV